MEQPPPKPDGRTGPLNTQIVVALIGAATTILAALLAGYFGMADRANGSPEPPATSIPSAGPSVTIEGPATAPVNRITYFTILSSNAVRAEWSIGGFTSGEPIAVEPLPPAHQIEVEPTNESRVGDTFTLAVTVYDENGNSASATHSFEVISEE